MLYFKQYHGSGGIIFVEKNKLKSKLLVKIKHPCLYEEKD